MENLPESLPDNLEEALRLVSPHYARINAALMGSYQETHNLRDNQVERGIICAMTPKTKGCIMSDALDHHLRSQFAGIEGVEVVNLSHYVIGLMFAGRVFVKFNKMDETHSPSIQQRKWYKAITNQGSEIDGVPEKVVKLWAGIVPIDKQWSDVARCSLVYYEGGTVAWYTNMTDETVKQLSIDITPEVQKRRAKPKKQDGEQDTKTGT